MLIFFIAALGFTTFSILCNGPQNRMSIVAILLLTSVNFRWIVTARLPSVSYLTLLDRFSIGCILVMALMFVWDAIVGSLVISSSVDYLKEIDMYVLILTAVCFVIFILFIVLDLVRIGVNFKRFKDKTKDEYLKSLKEKKAYALALRKKSTKP